MNLFALYAVIIAKWLYLVNRFFAFSAGQRSDFAVRLPAPVPRKNQ
jgi:hypothetical protein